MIHIFKAHLIALALAALALVGFAHKAHPLVLSPEMVSYLQAGGTIAEICDPTGDTGSGATETCEACRLIDTSLPDVYATGVQAASFGTGALQIHAAFAPILNQNPAGFSARAPPTRV